jgi:hypothetical protein
VPASDGDAITPTEAARRTHVPFVRMVVESTTVRAVAAHGRVSVPGGMTADNPDNPDGRGVA